MPCTRYLSITGLLLRSVLCSVSACSGDGADSADASSAVPVDAATLPDERGETVEGSLLGAAASSYSVLSHGVVNKVGVLIPLSAIAAVSADRPAPNDLILDMPASAKRQTFLSQLRVNWLSHGHGPTPYGAPHFDFHFHRGSSAEIDAIACPGGVDAFPPEILTADHQIPTTCVPAMGYHAWPIADAAPGATFTASLILGYTPTTLIFVEPMIAQTTLLQGRDFELAITAPEKSGGARTRFPARMRALYRDNGSTLALEFDQFSDLD
jgi:hypothetical protein